MIDHNDALLARARAAFSTASVLPNASSQGLSGARNTGIDASTGDIVCFLDDDAAAEEDWSTHLLLRTRTADVLGVGGAATPAWETAEAGLVAGRVRLGRGLQLSRAADHDVAGPEPDGLQHVAAPHASWRRSVASTPGWVATATTSSAARRPSSASGPDSCFPTASSCTSRRPSCTITYPASGRPGATSADRCRAEGISKARVARRVGRSAALASEAGYVRRVLPTGVLTNLGRSLHGDLAGVARAGAIVAGLGLTATGFLSARWAPRRRPARIARATERPRSSCRPPSRCCRW